MTSNRIPPIHPDKGPNSKTSSSEHRKVEEKAEKIKKTAEVDIMKLAHAGFEKW